MLKVKVSAVIFKVENKLRPELTWCALCKVLVGLSITPLQYLFIKPTNETTKTLKIVE
jgi:hypothetical protein